MVNIESQLILVVDDSPDALGMINQALEHAGMTALVALDGKQAMTVALKMKPDVILLDALMPGMDGFETCLQLKALPELTNVPIIFMTGLSDTESIVKGFNAGGVDFLTKPVNPIELIARMRVHLSNAKTTESAQAALDTAGHNLMAVSKYGDKAWATPLCDEQLTLLSEAGNLQQFLNQLHSWLKQGQIKDNKFNFNLAEYSYSCVFLGMTGNNEYLLRVINNQEMDQKKLLIEKFSITQREAEVFLWLAKGKTNREIAEILEISPRTINKHLEQLFKKLNVFNRTAAAAMAIECIQQH